MRMRKKQFRIGHLAATLGVDDFVIRFWEKEFKLTTQRSQGGQRFYTTDDLERFKSIQELLHKKGFTIAGAKQALSAHPASSHRHHATDEHEILVQHCLKLKKKLRALQEML